MTLYTYEIQRIFKSIKAPYRGFIVDLVEHGDYLELRVYQDNVESFSEPQKVALAEYLFRLQEAINLSGTKCYVLGSLDPVPYAKWEGS